MKKKPMIIDTDGAIDDCVALWLGLTSSEADIVGITTVSGVVSAEQAAANVAKVLHAANRRDIPVAIGAAQALGPKPSSALSGNMAHGGDGLGDTNIPEVSMQFSSKPAHELILKLAKEYAHEIHLVTLGPLTNIALALRQEPQLAKLVYKLVTMGGAIRPPGNMTAVAEYNIIEDAQAAFEVVTAPWSQPPTLISLDVTRLTSITEKDKDLFAKELTPAAKFLAKPVAFYWQAQAMANPEGCPIHDALALIAAIHPQVVECEQLPLTVDIGGHAAWGQTVADLRALMLKDERLPKELKEMGYQYLIAGKSLWNIALKLDREYFIKQIRKMIGGD